MIYFFKFVLFVFVISIPFKNTVYQVSLVILILMFFLHVYLNKNYLKLKLIYLEFKNIIYIFLLLIGTLSISNLININLENDSLRALLSFIYKFGLLFFVLIYFYAINYFKEKELVTYVLLSILLQLSIGVYQAIVYHDVLSDIKNISNGITGQTFNRNQFGLIMGIGAIISLLYFKEKFIKILFPIFILGAIFSYSRAVWVAFIFSIVLYGIFNIKNFKLKDIIIIISIFLICLVLFFNIDSLSNRFEQLLNANSSGRGEIWLHTIALIKEKILFGYGLDSWKLHQLKNYSNIHNSILEILFVSGIAGLIVFLLIFITILREIFSGKNYLFLALISYFSIISLFDNSIFYSKIYLSFLIIFCIFIFKNRIDKSSIKGEK